VVSQFGYDALGIWLGFRPGEGLSSWVGLFMSGRLWGSRGRDDTFEFPKFKGV